jgi:mRNA interferase MazF
MNINRGEIGSVNLDPTMQLRGVDTQRFIQKLGSVSPAVMRSITAAIAAVVEY